MMEERWNVSLDIAAPRIIIPLNRQRTNTQQHKIFVIDEDVSSKMVRAHNPSSARKLTPGLKCK